MSLVVKLVLFFGLLYVGLTVAAWLLQSRLMYFPDIVRTHPSLFGLDGVEEITFKTPDDAEIVSWWARAKPGKPTLLYFHGNAGTAFHRGFYLDALSRFNLRVILAEYPGYAGRIGEPTETLLVNDAVETLRLAYQAYGEPLYLWGESLGSGVAASVVAKTEVPLKGVVLFLPWDSLASVAQARYWYIPVRWLLLDQYNSVENLVGYEGNIAVLLAEADSVIPRQHGNKLYQSVDTNKKLWLFKRAGHNSVPMDTELRWWKEVFDFISQ